MSTIADRETDWLKWLADTLNDYGVDVSLETLSEEEQSDLMAEVFEYTEELFTPEEVFSRRTLEYWAEQAGWSKTGYYNEAYPDPYEDDDDEEEEGLLISTAGWLL